MHLLSGLAFLVAGTLFCMLSFTSPSPHRRINFLPGIGLFAAALLQGLAYARKRHT
ncbi:MAG: hypothetical protein KGI56_02025 [Acidobacteriota bacterium]|nr:hypothetical protein [Acidobacteriota bacterium]